MGIKPILDDFERARASLHNKNLCGFSEVVEVSNIVDLLIRNLYRSLAKKSRKINIAIVALGGYGRRELCPASDIDIMFLYENILSAENKVLIKDMLYVLWDTKISIGHSTRSINECVNLAKGDITIHTSMLESRFVTGTRLIYSRYSKKMRFFYSHKTVKIFIKKKNIEWTTRHKKYNFSYDVLEPDIKEGVGGLRDYHTLLWMTKTKFHTSSLNPLVRFKWLMQDEYNAFIDSVDFLLMVRISLHRNGHGKSNILSLEMQHDISPYFVKSSSGDIQQPSEVFMRLYYQHAFNIHRITRRLIRKIVGLEFKERFKPIESLPSIRMSRGIFLTDGHELSIKKGSRRINKFNTPADVMKIFIMLQKHHLVPDGYIERMIETRISEFSKDHPLDQETYRLFQIILSNDKYVYHVLAIMLETGMLFYLFTDMQNLFGHVKHDAYHAYTTHRHTLLLIYYIESLKKSKNTDVAHLQEVLEGFKRDKWKLYLAALFHDIGKGYGIDHVEKGREIFKKWAEGISLDNDTFKIIDFLIENHLTMNHTAQRRNLHDPATIRLFASRVLNVRYLDALYLLTYADMSAVAPDVWTSWKSSLLRELYIKTRRYLEGLPPMMLISDQELQKLRIDIEQSVAPTLGKEWVQDFFESLDEDYFSSFTHEQIQLHLYLLHLLKTKPLVMDYYHFLDRGYTEVMIATENREKLFSRIVSVFSLYKINILKARIFTTGRNFALDIFQVSTLAHTPVSSKQKWMRLENNLSDLIINNKDPRAPEKINDSILEPHRGRQHRTPKVSFTNEASERYTIMDISTTDRLGLLYGVSKALADNKVNIHSAIIDTHRGNVHDTFYISTFENISKLDKNKISILQEKILSTLSRK